jgi:hypothetical protein
MGTKVWKSGSKGSSEEIQTGNISHVNFSFPHCFIAMRVKLLQTGDFRNSCRVLNKEMHTQIEVWPVPELENAVFDCVYL